MHPYVLVFIGGLVDETRLELEIVTPLQRFGEEEFLVHTSTLIEVHDYPTLFEAMLAGMVVVAREGDQQAFLVNLIRPPSRSVEEPATESVIRGPRDGFTEILDTNLALIRRRLKTDQLRIRSYRAGKLSRTEVRLLFLEGVADPKVVDEVSNRLSAIHIDGVLESNYIEEMIQDHPYSLFPTIQYTERPDVVAGSLLEGRVSILVDNTPFALIAPFQFWTALQASEDYYNNYIYATFVRMVRAIFIVMALMLPALYVAITTYHQEMLPTNLLFSVAAAREATPFPALVEAILMEITFEALREAGVRLPRPVGQAVSIVGALVIGQAAVQAGIVSAPMVIVVSLTGIASFTIPRFNMSFAIRILRFPMIFLAGSFGLFGIVFGLFVLGIHLTGIRTVGVPYLTPLAPFTITGIKDVVGRAPIWKMNPRPTQIAKQDQERFPQGATQEIHQPSFGTRTSIAKRWYLSQKQKRNQKGGNNST